MDFAPSSPTLPETASVGNAASNDPIGIGYGDAAYAKGVGKSAVPRAADEAAILPTAAAVADGPVRAAGQGHGDPFAAADSSRLLALTAGGVLAETRRSPGRRDDPHAPGSERIGGREVSGTGASLLGQEFPFTRSIVSNDEPQLSFLSIAGQQRIRPRRGGAWRSREYPGVARKDSRG